MNVGIKSFLRAEKSLPAGVDAVESDTGLSPGTNVCPICGEANVFLEFRGRPAEQCPTCKSLERTRHMFLFLMFAGYMDGVGTGEYRKDVAHFAPEPSLFQCLSDEGRNSNYHCFDIEPHRYQFASDFIQPFDLSRLEDISALPKVDILIHNHVLEHIPCDIRELVPRLSSRLKPGGVHAFSVPMRGKQTFDEDMSPNLTDAERKARFGQEDHVRIFGGLDVVAMMQGMLGQQDCVFRIHQMLTAQLAETFGVKNCYDLSRAGKVNGSSIFFKHIA